MNLKDRCAEYLLAAWDRIMDMITFSWWTRVRGDAVPNIKVKE